MIKNLKICGVSDPETLNYILNHHNPPNFIGFITNYKKSKRFVEYEKLKDLINVDKKNVSFVSVLVNPNDEILEKIKDLNFDYYQSSAVILQAGTPTAISTILMAEAYEVKQKIASKILFTTTLISIFTIPLIKILINVVN